MTGRRPNKRHTVKMRGAAGTREYEFVLSPKRITWKEKGKSEDTRISRTWEHLVGYALIHSSTPSRYLEDSARTMKVVLPTSDRSLDERDVDVTFGDPGVEMYCPWMPPGRDIVFLAWKSLISMGITGR